MEIELKGMREMIAKLKELRSEISGPAMKKAVGAGARVIKAEMISRAPVLEATTRGSSALPPGALRDGIRSYSPQGATPYEVLIGPNSKVAHVARWVEYGHRIVKGGYSKVLADGRVRGPGRELTVEVPAYPFLRPAFEASLAPTEEAIVDSMRKSIQEAVG